VQPRVKTDKTVVTEYAERLKAKDQLPPVVVFFDDKTHWLAEGFHRLEAHKKADWKQIDAIVIDGTKEDAQWHALQSNKDHGLRRSNEDKVRAVKMAMEHPKGEKMSDRAIADLLGVSPTMVAKYRPKESTANRGQSRKRKGRDGRTINTTKIGKTKRGNGKKAKPQPGEKANAAVINEVPTPQADRDDGGTSVAGAGGEQNGTAEKVPTPQAVRDGEQPAEEAIDDDDGGVVVIVQDADLVDDYRRMLEELPTALAELAEHVNDIAGKAMEPKAAMDAMCHICASIDALCSAEEKLAEGST